MTSEAAAPMSSVTLKIRVMGRDRLLDVPHIEDGLEAAVSLITTGQAIPKGIFREGLEVCSEQDINTYWEQSVGHKKDKFGN